MRHVPLLILALLLIGCAPKKPAPLLQHADNSIAAAAQGVFDAQGDLVFAKKALGSAKDAHIDGAMEDLTRVQTNLKSADLYLQSASTAVDRFNALYESCEWVGWRLQRWIRWIIGLGLLGIIAAVVVANALPAGVLYTPLKSFVGFLFSIPSRIARLFRHTPDAGKVDMTVTNVPAASVTVTHADPPLLKPQLPRIPRRPPKKGSRP